MSRKIVPFIVEKVFQPSYHLQSSKIPTELIKSSQALFTAYGGGNLPSLPDLSYDYNALEPVISAETMELHHSKHHRAYVTNLNAALAKLDTALSTGDISGIIATQGALKFNGGGHLNHTLFWENLTSSKTCPSGILGDAINTSFGSFDKMKDEMTAKSIAVQGSGWGWLGYNASTGRLEVATCANQDPLLATTGLIPLVGIDVWEHAYYVDYRNVRPDYVKAVWNVINWDVAAKRYAEATK